MVTKKMTSKEFIEDVSECFQEGDTLTWKNGFISYFGEGMNILSEYDLATGIAHIY